MKWGTGEVGVGASISGRRDSAVDCREARSQFLALAPGDGAEMGGIGQQAIDDRQRVGAAQEGNAGSREVRGAGQVAGWPVLVADLHQAAARFHEFDAGGGGLAVGQRAGRRR